MTDPTRPRMGDIAGEKVCFNCGKEAIQRVEVGPGGTMVTCMNCGIVRHYTAGGVSLSQGFDDRAGISCLKRQ
jgi:hypothetical protein